MLELCVGFGWMADLKFRVYWGFGMVTLTVWTVHALCTPASGTLLALSLSLTHTSTLLADPLKDNTPNTTRKEKTKVETCGGVRRSFMICASRGGRPLWHSGQPTFSTNRGFAVVSVSGPARFDTWKPVNNRDTL